MRTGLYYSMDMVPGKNPADFYTELLEQVQLADDVGFESVWLGERHFNDEAPAPAPQSLLAAFATATKGIRIGSAFKTLPLDNPIRVAEDFAVLDLMSNGRVTLGVEVGHDEEAFRTYNVPFAERWERFQEWLDIIRKSWTYDGLSYAGKFYKIPLPAQPASPGQPFKREPYVRPYTVQWLRAGKVFDYLPVTPKPVQSPHPPIWVGGLGVDNQLIEFAARRGFTYLPSPLESFATVKARVNLYQETLLAAGRDPSEVEWPLIRHFYVAESDEAARRDVEGPLSQLYQRYQQKGLVSLAEGKAVLGADLTFETLLEDRAIVGGWETVVDKIKTYYDEVGINHIICHMSFPGLEHERVMAAIRLFASEVWTKLQA